MGCCAFPVTPVAWYILQPHYQSMQQAAMTPACVARHMCALLLPTEPAGAVQTLPWPTRGVLPCKTMLSGHGQRQGCCWVVFQGVQANLGSCNLGILHARNCCPTKGCLAAARTPATDHTAAHAQAAAWASACTQWGFHPERLRVTQAHTRSQHAVD